MLASLAPGEQPSRGFVQASAITGLAASDTTPHSCQILRRRNLFDTSVGGNNGHVGALGLGGRRHWFCEITRPPRRGPRGPLAACPDFSPPDSGHHLPSPTTP